MLVHVAFTPEEDARAPLGVVVDVLRACLGVLPRFAGMRGPAAEIVAA